MTVLSLNRIVTRLCVVLRPHEGELREGKQATVSIDGSADVIVNVSDTLKARIGGLAAFTTVARPEWRHPSADQVPWSGAWTRTNDLAFAGLDCNQGESP